MATTGGRKVECFTEAVDILPTLLDLLEATCRRISTDARWRRFWTARCRGTGATPRIGSSISARSPTVMPNGISASAPRQCNLAVIRTEKFKYVHFGGGLPPLLFDLEKDPGEMNNVAADPAYLPLRLEIAERLLAWRAEHLDQSLALAELTEDGVAGYVAGLPHLGGQ